MLSIKNRHDIWPILVTCILFSLQLATLFLPLLWSVILTFVIIFLCGTTAAFQHHHGHCAVFKNKRINEILDSIMSLQSGITPYAWVLHHNIGHHGNYMNQYPQKGEEIIDASNWSREDGSVMTRWEYVWFNRTRMHPRCTEVGNKAKKIFNKYVIFRRVHFVVLALLLILGTTVGGWQGFIFSCVVFLLIPQMMVAFVFETTYDHHSGLFTDNKYEASRNILGSFYNLFRLNLGFHTAHHIKPGLHWSDLPQYHASIEQHIPEVLMDRSQSLIRTILSNSNATK
jgi:beta-carotene hydroxylase